MTKKVLITGGAGFIGSHLADQLIRDGHRVRVLDNLSSQVHGPRRGPPDYLNDDVELVIGDVRDAAAVERALAGIDRVVHLAAAVGVGQSMYSVDTYTSVNNFGTAVLLQALLARPVERLVVASSMSIYGEGLYQSRGGQHVEVASRSLEQLKAKDWELRDGHGEPLNPLPTPETKAPAFGSVYALSKYDQEQLCLMLGRAYNISTVALRFFNVYGPRQALSNPYTGVLAIFATRLLNGNRPLIFEDGRQRRDFVSVHDVARACRMALDRTDIRDTTLNIGSGEAMTVREVAERLAGSLGLSTAPDLTERYRFGDIRHCFADVSRARDLLGYRAEVDFATGVCELAEWLEREIPTDHVPQAHAELASRGLTI